MYIRSRMLLLGRSVGGADVLSFRNPLGEVGQKRVYLRRQHCFDLARPVEDEVPPRG